LQQAVAQSASKAYDRAQPVTSALGHEYADLELKEAMEQPYDRVRFSLAAVSPVNICEALSARAAGCSAKGRMLAAKTISGHLREETLSTSPLWGFIQVRACMILASCVSVMYV
jgi:hypothetical protein